MANLTKTKLPIASHNRCQLDLTSQHVTTSDFLQFGVTKCIEMVPNQSINIKHECFSRLTPLYVPTFGRANIQHRAFFVPMRTIMPAWNDFITDTPHHFSSSSITQAPSIVTSVPSFTNLVLVSSIYDTNSEFSTIVATEAESDFQYSRYSTGSTPTLQASEYRKFTKLGRFAWKLLRSLGYNPVFTNLNTDVYSAMPLLAAARIYYDYFYPPQYHNDDDSAFIYSLVTNDVKSNDTFLTTSRLQRLFKILYKIPYPSDYFVSAWDTPTSPSLGHFSEIQMMDSTSPSQVIGTPNSQTEEFAGTVEIYGNSAITQFALNALKGLSDYMKRHQIVGSKALDRYLSRFGVKLSNEKLNRSVMIKEYNQDIKFGDVTSTAATENATLGAYAGRGLSYGDNNIDFTTDEYGYLFIVSTISPFVQYFQGMERKVNHLTRFDFFTPELDNLGTQALGAKELYVPIVTDAYDATYQDKVFGFVPRYAEYKVPYSQLTGDLSLNSFKVSSEPWTLYRDMSFIYTNNDNNPAVSFDDIHHGINFVMANDAQQYNRIFNYQGNEENGTPEVDHFNVIHNFDISSSFPGKSLYNDYNFEDEDKSQKVTVDVGGSNAMN